MNNLEVDVKYKRQVFNVLKAVCSKNGPENFLSLVEQRFEDLQEGRRRKASDNQTKILSILKECLVSHRWIDILRILPIVTRMGCEEGYGHLVFKSAFQALSNLQLNDTEALEQFLWSMPNVYEVYLPEAALESLIYFLSRGQFQEANKTSSYLLGVLKRKRKNPGRITAAKDRINTLLTVYQGVYEYFDWTKLLHQIQEGNPDPNILERMEKSAENASVIFDKLLQMPGEFDVIINKHVQLKDYDDKTDEATNDLRKYAANNPDHWTAHQLLYDRLAAYHPDRTQERYKVLKDIMRIYQGDGRILDIVELATDPIEAVDALFLLLDFPQWCSHSYAWFIFSRSLFKLLLSSRELFLLHVRPRWEQRKDLWLRNCFKFPQDTTDLPLHLLYKAIVIILAQELREESDFLKEFWKQKISQDWVVKLGETFIIRHGNGIDQVDANEAHNVDEPADIEDEPADIEEETANNEAEVIPEVQLEAQKNDDLNKRSSKQKKKKHKTNDKKREKKKKKKDKTDGNVKDKKKKKKDETDGTVKDKKKKNETDGNVKDKKKKKDETDGTVKDKKKKKKDETDGNVKKKDKSKKKKDKIKDGKEKKKKKDKKKDKKKKKDKSNKQKKTVESTGNVQIMTTTQNPPSSSEDFQSGVVTVTYKDVTSKENKNSSKTKGKQNSDKSKSKKQPISEVASKDKTAVTAPETLNSPPAPESNQQGRVSETLASPGIKRNLINDFSDNLDNSARKKRKTDNAETENLEDESEKTLPAQELQTNEESKTPKKNSWAEFLNLTLQTGRESSSLIVKTPFRHEKKTKNIGNTPLENSSVQEEVTDNAVASGWNGATGLDLGNQSVGSSPGKGIRAENQNTETENNKKDKHQKKDKHKEGKNDDEKKKKEPEEKDKLKKKKDKKREKSKKSKGNADITLNLSLQNNQTDVQNFNSDQAPEDNVKRKKRKAKELENMEDPNQNKTHRKKQKIREIENENVTKNADIQAEPRCKDIGQKNEAVIEVFGNAVDAILDKTLEYKTGFSELPFDQSEIDLFGGENDPLIQISPLKIAKETRASGKHEREVKKVKKCVKFNLEKSNFMNFMNLSNFADGEKVVNKSAVSETNDLNRSAVGLREHDDNYGWSRVSPGQGPNNNGRFVPEAGGLDQSENDSTPSLSFLQNVIEREKQMSVSSQKDRTILSQKHASQEWDFPSTGAFDPESNHETENCMDQNTPVLPDKYTRVKYKQPERKDRENQTLRAKENTWPQNSNSYQNGHVSSPEDFQNGVSDVTYADAAPKSRKSRAARVNCNTSNAEYIEKAYGNSNSPSSWHDRTKRPLYQHSSQALLIDDKSSQESTNVIPGTP